MREGRGRRARRTTRGTPRRLAALAVAAPLALVGCAGAESLQGGGEGTSLQIAIVANPQMQDAIALSPHFREDHPNVDLQFVTLPENEARAKITTAVATQSGQFDIVMISNYEAPQWAEYGWLTNLQPYAEETEGYDPGDFFDPIAQSLSYQDDLYAVPFYGESSFLMYRKDLFEAAGLTMPENPTWPEVRDFAEQLDDEEAGVAGICLRGLPGWGEVMAPLDTVVNTFGGRWYDMEWNAQLTSPDFTEAVQFYVDLVQAHGQPGAPSTGFAECATRYGQGQAAMWYDATVAAGVIEDPQSSTVVGKNGFAPAPVVETESSGWLYSWALAIPETTEHPQAAWDFVSWMTSPDYMRLVGEEIGWNSVPPGSRESTYEIPEYQEAASAYAPPTLAAIRAADPKTPTVEPVPYTGIQFLAIPEFQDLGTRVSQQISAAIAGQVTVEEALEQSQQYARTVGETYQ